MKPTELLKKVYIATGSIFAMALYFCSLKFVTLVSKISEFEIMYHRSFWGLTLIMFFQNFIRTPDDPQRASFFDGITRFQIPYLAVRVIATSISHLLVLMALKITSTSKVILILENPFLTSIMAFFLIGEKITAHEVFVFIVATVGIFFLA